MHCSPINFGPNDPVLIELWVDENEIDVQDVTCSALLAVTIDPLRMYDFKQESYARVWARCELGLALDPHDTRAAAAAKTLSPQHRPTIASAVASVQSLSDAAVLKGRRVSLEKPLGGKASQKRMGARASMLLNRVPADDVHPRRSEAWSAEPAVLVSAGGKQLCCRPGTAVKLLWPVVNPALRENLAIEAPIKP
jgi:hypothetical protein